MEQNLKILHPSYLVADILNNRFDSDMLSAFEMRELLYNGLLNYYKKVSFADGILTAEEPKHEGVQKYYKVYLRMKSQLAAADVHLLNFASRVEMLENYFTFDRNSVRILVTNYLGSRLRKAIRRMKPPIFVVCYDGKVRRYIAEEWRRG